MAETFQPKFLDLVRNYTSTTGTGNLVLSGAVAGFADCAAALEPGDRFYYSVTGIENTTESEVGRGTMQADGTIARDPIDGRLTNFSKGTKTVALVAAAEWFESVGAARGAPLVAASEAELAQLKASGAALLTAPGRGGPFVFDTSDLSAEVEADTAQGIYVAPASDMTGASGAWVRVHDGALNARWFGIDGNGAEPDDFTGLLSYLATRTEPVQLLFPPRHYKIGSKVDLDLPPSSTVEATGAVFTGTHDGVMFDLNPAATATLPRTTFDDNVTKRFITWNGGQFLNSNASKTASVAIQAYFMRFLTIRDVRCGEITGPTVAPYAFVKFGAKDTYHFIDCFSYGCVRHYWVPAPGVLFTPSLTGNDLIDPEWRGCHMNVNGSQAGIYMETRVLGMKVNGGSFNGVSSVAHIRLSDNGNLASRRINIDAHFEQMGSGVPAILFDASGGQGFHYVNIRGEFSSATAGWIGVRTAKCLGITIDAHFQDGSGGTTEIGIQLDSLSRGIVIHDGLNYATMAQRFLSLTTPVSLNGADRNHVTLVPETISIPNVAINDGVTSLNARNGDDLGATLIDMSAASSTVANSVLPPIAYTVGLRHRDSASAAAAGTINAGLMVSTAATPFVQVDLRGVANNEDRVANGRVRCDANGDIAAVINATGPAAATTTAHLLAIHR
jgi:hypothetical protein